MVVKKSQEPKWIGTGLDESAKLIRGLAERDLPCLIVGQTGTGKELLAELYAHTWITRYGKSRYHRLNCTGFVEGLLTSHLFGYEGGAFTGASPRGKSGLVADNDLVCLDELGDASPNFQAQVLRVVEYGSFTRVGGTKEEHTNCRFIGSTNRADGIRRDLSFRFHFVHVPPLALRGEDFAALVHRFGREAGVVEFTRRFAAWSAQYSWPGNVRELRRRLEAAGLGPGCLLDIPDAKERAREPALYQSWNDARMNEVPSDQFPLHRFGEIFFEFYTPSGAENAMDREEYRQVRLSKSSDLTEAIASLDCDPILPIER